MYFSAGIQCITSNCTPLVFVQSALDTYRALPNIATKKWVKVQICLFWKSHSTKNSRSWKLSYLGNKSKYIYRIKIPAFSEFIWGPFRTSHYIFLILIPMIIPNSRLIKIPGKPWGIIAQKGTVSDIFSFFAFPPSQFVTWLCCFVTNNRIFFV